MLLNTVNFTSPHLSLTKKNYEKSPKLKFYFRDEPATPIKKTTKRTQKTLKQGTITDAFDKSKSKAKNSDRKMVLDLKHLNEVASD